MSSELIPGWVSPALIRDQSTDYSTTPLEHQALVFTRGVTLVVGRPRNDRRPVLSLSYRFEDDAVADGPYAAARTLARRVAGRVAAEARRQAAAEATRPEAIAAAEAAAAARAAEAELEAARRVLADLKQQHTVELQLGKNPAHLAESILVAERKVAATAEYATTMQARARKAAEAAKPRVDVGRLWSTAAWSEKQKLAQRRAELKAKAEQVARELADELLEIYWAEKELDGPMPTPAPPEPPAEAPVAPDGPAGPDQLADSQAAMAAETVTA